MSPDELMDEWIKGWLERGGPEFEKLKRAYPLLDGVSTLTEETSNDEFEQSDQTN